MKSSRFQYAYRKSASKLHKMVGNSIRNLFSNMEIYQEYPVVRVNKNYSESRHHFDWVIPQLKLVIECHGKQHYEPVAFDGDMDQAIADYAAGKTRDRIKKEAALEAGFTYIEIPYTIKQLSSNDLFELIELAKADQKGYTEIKHELTKMEISKKIRSLVQKEKRQQYLGSDVHKEQLKKAKEYRKERYQKLKEK